VLKNKKNRGGNRFSQAVTTAKTKTNLQKTTNLKDQDLPTKKSRRASKAGGFSLPKHSLFP